MKPLDRQAEPLAAPGYGPESLKLRFSVLAISMEAGEDRGWSRHGRRNQEVAAVDPGRDYSLTDRIWLQRAHLSGYVFYLPRLIIVSTDGGRGRRLHMSQSAPPRGNRAAMLPGYVKQRGEPDPNPTILIKASDVLIGSFLD